MNFKKFCILFLTIILLVASFSGCSTKNSYSGKYAEAFDTFPGDEVIMTVGESEVTWKEFFYWLAASVVGIESYFSEGYVTDWDIMLTEDYNVAESVMHKAEETVIYYHGVNYLADELGVSLSNEELEEIDSIIQSNIEQYGSEEALNEALGANYADVDLVRENYKIYYLIQKCIMTMYGEDGSGISDEELEIYAEDNGYYCAKHILLMTVDETGTALSEEEIAEKRDTIQNLLEQLKESDDPVALFDELMNEYSEDTGLEYYPDGYCFTDGDMVEEFYAGTAALEENQFSDIIETAYGYHIIMRLPMDYSMIPSSWASYGYTFREVVINEQFDSIVLGVAYDLGITYTDAYEKIKVPELFTAVDTNE